MPIGVAKGLGGLVAKPVRGTFDLVAQPIAGAWNTPGYLINKVTAKPDSVKELNFARFGA